MRLLCDLSWVLPCSLTTRLRANQTSYCMKRMWSDFY
jgi:hypothetical protein